MPATNGSICGHNTDQPMPVPTISSVPYGPPMLCYKYLYLCHMDRPCLFPMDIYPCPGTGPCLLQMISFRAIWELGAMPVIYDIFRTLRLAHACYK